MTGAFFCPSLFAMHCSGGSNVSSAVRALRRFERNAAATELAVLGSDLFGLLFALHFIHALNQHKHRKSDNQKTEEPYYKGVINSHHFCQTPGCPVGAILGFFLRGYLDDFRPQLCLVRRILAAVISPSWQIFFYSPKPSLKKRLGESAKGTSPSAALRTQREPLSSLGSHYPTIGRTPSFQCGNMPGCMLAISPSLCSARLLWCLSFLYFLIAHKQSLRLMCFNVGYIADL